MFKCQERRDKYDLLDFTRSQCACLAAGGAVSSPPHAQLLRFGSVWKSFPCRDGGDCSASREGGRTLKLLVELEERRRKEEEEEKTDWYRAALDALRNSHSLQLFEPRPIKGSGLSTDFGRRGNLFFFLSSWRCVPFSTLEAFALKFWVFPPFLLLVKRDSETSAEQKLCNSSELGHFFQKTFWAWQSFFLTYRVVWDFELKRGVLKCKSTFMRKQWHKRQGTEAPRR